MIGYAPGTHGICRHCGTTVEYRQWIAASALDKTEGWVHAATGDEACSRATPVTVNGQLPDVACSWCGRAIYLDREARDEGPWAAVKGRERGYDPYVCDANDEEGRHEP